MMPAAPNGTVDAPAADTRPTFRQALRFWLKLGFISFGGPAGQIAVMHRELVEKRGWISEKRFLHALNYCMLLPGPEAQQLATYLGWLMHRTLGGIVAGLLFILPSLAILIALSWIYAAHGQQPLIAAMFWGIKPAITAIVLHAAWRIGSRALSNRLLVAIAVSAFAAIFFLNAPFPAIVLGAALIGIVGNRLLPAAFVADRHPGDTGEADDRRPEHTRFRWPRLIAIAIAGLALWAIPMLLLTHSFGGQHLLTQMAAFFTRAALLTFGGAYAVLPYVHQAAVEQHGWLSAAQMIDGLALGETTPGPLIMVVAFVGFIGAWNHAILGPDELFAAGALAAALVTWFTFLPSFLLVLAGGPVIESTHGRLGFTAPLTAITAAVVGVILNLALFFASHVFWPQGATGSFDGAAAAIAAAAAFALFRLRRGIIEVIAGAALCGIAIRFLAGTI